MSLAENCIARTVVFAAVNVMFFFLRAVECSINKAQVYNDAINNVLIISVSRSFFRSLSLLSPVRRVGTVFILCVHILAYLF